MEERSSSADGLQPIPWEPEKVLRSVPSVEARLSRGFLRCRPERWLPGLSTHWITLAHSLGVEFDVLEVKPFVSIPRGFDQAFVGTVDDEPIAFALEEEALQTLIDVIIPGSPRSAGRVLAEYLARRLLTSLGLSWSGPELSNIRFDSEMNASDLRFAAGIRVTFSVNGSSCVVWISLGKLMIDKLDGLWRRQIHSTGKVEEEENGQYSLELTQLAVPPSMLSQYTKKGAVIDLETSLSDDIILSHNGSPWSKAKLCIVDSVFGFEIVPQPVPQFALPEGTTRLSLSFGEMTFNTKELAEISQAGAVCETTLPVSNRVSMRIGGEPVSEGVLCSFEGRFAVSVV